ncbi:MAG: anaerobic ribonucleoside-triphosphate reductase activating protein [Muribaculaceae bacterium]
MRIIDIIEGTTVDGPGLRTSIYFAGCAHKCPGCHNRQTWDFGGGAATTAAEVMERVLDADFNVTLTGGDPMYQAAELLPLVKSITEAGYTIWCYTGFEWADIIADHDMAALLPFIQVVVDGPYIESQRDPDLLFRGSANQRLIDVRASLDAAAIVLWHRD